jgi:hypothetical protein
MQSTGQVPQNQLQCASHMTDILPYGSTHPAPPFSTAFNSLFFAGSVNPLHKSPQRQQAFKLRTARATEMMARPQESKSPSGPAGW